MRLEGQCHCGAIAFEAEGDPESVFVCHCTDCQAASGTAFRTNIRVSGESFRITRGEPKRYVKTTAESGAKRLHAFCDNCGSPVFATSMDAKPASYSLRLGTLRQRDQLAPKKQIWFRSARPWLAQLMELPKADRGG